MAAIFFDTDGDSDRQARTHPYNCLRIQIKKKYSAKYPIHEGKANR